MKSIPHLYRECKHLLSRVPNEVLVLILCLLVLTVGYVLGYKSAQEVMGKGSQVVSIDEGKGREGAAYELSPASGEGQKSLPAGAYMGSKNGTKYYAPWCASAQRIKPENIVWFESENDALSKGYSKTTSCSF